MLLAGLLLTALLLSCAEGALHDHRLESGSVGTEVPSRVRLPDVGVEERPSGSPEFPLIIKSQDSPSGANALKYSFFLPGNFHSSRVKTQSASKYRAGSSLESHLGTESRRVLSRGNNFSVKALESKGGNFEFTKSQGQHPHKQVDQKLGAIFAKGNILPYSLLTIPKTVLQYLISIKRDNRNTPNTSNNFRKNKIPVHASAVSNPSQNGTVFASSFILKTLTKTNEFIPSTATLGDQFETDFTPVNGDLHNLNLFGNLTVESNDTDHFIDSHQKLFIDLPSSLSSSVVNLTRQMILTNSSVNGSGLSHSQDLPIAAKENSIMTTVSVDIKDQQPINYFHGQETTVSEMTENFEVGRERGINLHAPQNARNFENTPNKHVGDDSKFEYIPLYSNLNRRAVVRSLSDRAIAIVDNPMVQIEHGNPFYSSATENILHHPSTVEEDVREDTKSSVLLDTNLKNSPKLLSFSETTGGSRSGTFKSTGVESERTLFSKVSNKSSANDLEIWRSHRRRPHKTSFEATQPPAERTTRRQRRTMYVVVVEERPCEGACCKREHYTGRCRLVLGCALLRFHFLAVRKLSCETNFQATLGDGPSLETPPTRPRTSIGDSGTFESEVPDNSTDSLINRNVEVPETINLPATNLSDNSNFSISRAIIVPSTNLSTNLDVSPRTIFVPSTDAPLEITIHNSLPNPGISGHSLINSSSALNIIRPLLAGTSGNRQFMTSNTTSRTVNLSSVNIGRTPAANESTLLNLTSVHLDKVTIDNTLGAVTFSPLDLNFGSAASFEGSDVERKIARSESANEELSPQDDAMVTQPSENSLNSLFDIMITRPEKTTFAPFISDVSQHVDNSSYKMRPWTTSDSLDFITGTSHENTTMNLFLTSQENVYAKNNSYPKIFDTSVVALTIVTNSSDSVHPTTEVLDIKSGSSITDNSNCDNNTNAILETPCYKKDTNKTFDTAHVPSIAKRYFNASSVASRVNKKSESKNETLHTSDARDDLDATSSSSNWADALPTLPEDEGEKEASNEADAGEWDAYITDELSIDYNYEEYTTDPEYGYYYYDEHEEHPTEQVFHTDQVWISQAGAPGPLELSEIESVALGRNRGRAEEADAEWINEDNRRGPHLVMSSHTFKRRRR